MTDRELLELAAKAAGIELVWHGDTDPFCFAETVAGIKWNPLTDNGDALWLAVNLDIVPRVINGVAFAWRDGVCDIQEPHNGDPYAATRRAIVRAAAEIGRSKE